MNVSKEVKMNYLKRIRLKNIYNYITFFLLIPFAVTLVILFVYSAYMSITHERELIDVAVEDISGSIDSSLSEIAGETLRSTFSNEFRYFSNSSSYNTVNRYAGKLMEDCEMILFSNPEVIGIFLYNDQCDYYSSSFNTFGALFINQEVLNSVIKGEKAELSEGRTSLYNKKINETIYSFYSLSDRYGTITVMMNLQKAPKLINYNSIYNDSTVFSLSTGIPSPQDYFHRKIDSADLYLVYSFHSNFYLSPLQIVLLVIIIILLVALPIILWIITRLIVKPLNLVSESMKIITEGDFDYRVPAVKTIIDISDYVNGINMMLDAIGKYKEEEYNSRIDSIQARLQYLQLQIRPHFYLNCMKELNSLMDLKEYYQVKTLIYALSSYISYSFSDIKNFVSVREELESIQNYVNLCNSLAYNIHLSFKLDGDCASMNCLPMSLLTFVENSIKHTKNSKELSIWVKVETVAYPENQKMLKYTLKDSGGGFPMNIIEEQEKISSTKIIYRRNHIGINNVRYRLSLIYGTEASLALRNEGNNAIVEIITPSEKNSERTFYEHTNCG